MTSILSWIETTIDFPGLSFLKPLFAVSILLLVLDLTYQFVFLFFGKFFK